MKKISFLFLLLVVNFVFSQHTISGNFTPSKDYKWLIAYKLRPGTQVYIADTEIKNGSFTLTLPQKAVAGSYRLVYAVPQEEFYFDVIYNGKENITLNFDSDQGVEFTSSEENIVFNNYFNAVRAIEKSLIGYYSAGESNKKAYKEILKKYTETQSTYEENSKHLLAHKFIKANRPYIPESYEDINTYAKNRKEAYFNHLNLTNLSLQASGFLTDKITNYVFTALPLEPLEKDATENIIKANVDTVFDQLKVTSDAYSFHTFYNLWMQATASDFNETADYIYNTYIKTSPKAAKNKTIINKIELYNRLRIGAIAPEISWKKGDGIEKLSNLEGAKNYILIFWSSTCGHCLKEIPPLHKELMNNDKVQVVAVGLEDNDTSWKIQTAKLASFEHAIALGKWQSEYAKLYDIHSTPTYFILDTNKRIIAKPENDKEVINFLKNQH